MLTTFIILGITILLFVWGRIPAELVALVSMLALILMMLGAAVLSAFISNTGTVATLLPAVVAGSWRIGSKPSRFLIPLSFAASTGGLLTLTGSPPNIIVADALSNGGYRLFGYFEFAWIGVPLLLLFLAVSLVTIPVIWPL